MSTELVTTQPSNSPSLSTKSSFEAFPALDSTFVIIMGVMTLTAIAVPLYIYRLTYKQSPFNFKVRSKIPCNLCQYFNGNPYLKCALHPTTALTEQAIGCTDYCSHSQAKRVKE